MKPRDAWADKLRCIWRTLPSGFSRATEVWFGREVGPSRIGKYLQVVAERVFGVVVGEGFAKVGVEFRPFELEIELLLLAKEGVHVDGFGDDRRFFCCYGQAEGGVDVVVGHGGSLSEGIAWMVR